MATYSGILAWKIPGTEEPSGLHHGVAKSQTHRNTHTHTHTLNPVKSRGIKLKDGSRSLGAPGGPSHSTWGDV